MKTIQKNCLHCNISFDASLKEHKRGNAKYCSKTCSYDQQKKRKLEEKLTRPTNGTCSWCQADFYRSPSKITINSKSGLNFCCRTCKDTAQKVGGLKEIQPPHYDTGETKYRKRALAVYPHECIDCEYSDHADVLQVHHLDDDRTNNAVENLVIVCPRCHIERHAGHRPNVDYKGVVVMS